MKVNLPLVFLSYESGVRYLNNQTAKIGVQKTIEGVTKEIRELIRVMRYGQAISPITVTFEDVQAMDTKGIPRLEKMKSEIAREMLVRADAIVSPHYKANPVGQPFESRIGASIPVLDKFLRVAMLTSRKNAQRLSKRRINRTFRRGFV